MDGTAGPVGVGPQLFHRPDETGCPVGHDEERAAEAAPDEAAPELRPVLDALALPEADVEQDPLAVGGEAPGDEDALFGALGPDQQANLAEAAGPDG
jgi:hypothetical protein